MPKQNITDKLYHYNAKVISVYDGDTLTVNIDLGMNIWIEIHIRMMGINAPEMKGASKSVGTKSRDYLRGLIVGKDVVIQTVKDKTEKYGRYLGIIYVKQSDGTTLNVNQDMIDKGHAVKFMEGKT